MCEAVPRSTPWWPPTTQVATWAGRGSQGGAPAPTNSCFARRAVHARQLSSPHTPRPCVRCWDGEVESRTRARWWCRLSAHAYACLALWLSGEARRGRRARQSPHRAPLLGRAGSRASRLLPSRVCKWWRAAAARWSTLPVPRRTARQASSVGLRPRRRGFSHRRRASSPPSPRRRRGTTRCRSPLCPPPCFVRAHAPHPWRALLAAPAQYHFFFPGFFLATRVFSTASLQHHSAWLCTTADNVVTGPCLPSSRESPPRVHPCKSPTCGLGPQSCIPPTRTSSSCGPRVLQPSSCPAMRCAYPTTRPARAHE